MQFSNRYRKPDNTTSGEIDIVNDDNISHRKIGLKLNLIKKDNKQYLCFANLI